MYRKEQTRIKRFFALLCSVLLLLSLCACSGEKRPSAEEGLRDILDGLIGEEQSDGLSPWMEYYFQGERLDVEGLDLQSYGSILFKQLKYEILSVREKGKTATAKLRLENQYLAQSFIGYWAWLDNEYVHFSNTYLLMQDCYDQAASGYVTEVELTLRYEPQLEVEAEQPVGAWVICCDDAVINAFLGDILKTDYLSNGARFLATEQTAGEIRQLADDVRQSFAALNGGDQTALSDLRQQYFKICYYNELLGDCSSAWEFSWCDSGIELLSSLQTAAEQCLAQTAGWKVDLAVVVDQPLQEFSNT